MRSALLGTLLILVSLAAFTNTVSTDQTVTVTTTVGGPSSVQTTSACWALPAIYMQALGFLLILVLIFAVVVVILLIRLYRKTKF